jgi:hypothetical protein
MRLLRASPGSVRPLNCGVELNRFAGLEEFLVRPARDLMA